MFWRPIIRWFLVLAIGWAGVSATGAEPDRILFNRDVRPILSDNCFHCHGPDAGHRKAGLRLDVEEGARADLGGYQAVVPGKPEESALVHRITTLDPDDQMPPPDSGKALSDEEKKILRRWVGEGATWSQHWAYVPPQRHPEPVVRRETWPVHWVDRFILQRLEEEGLEPSPPADRITLVRRLSFDLTGLPPSPERVAAFASDVREDAYELLVDELLASPAFGERMAMYWLDLVRYADTVGYHGDQDHSISPYRDWVIEAFNRNLPFDRFTREQLAGDMMPGSEVWEKVASGYNRLLQTSHEGGVQEKEYLAIYAADRVRNLSSVWMGATVGCAQCHDHKYDPYTLRDFYSLAAFFADIDDASHLRNAPNSLPTRREPEMEVFPDGLQDRLTELRKLVAAWEAELKTSSPEGAEAIQARVAEAKAEMDAIRQQARRTMFTKALRTPRVTRILPRGNWLDESGEVVEPAVPAFLGRVGVEGRRANRLDLADWLLDTEEGIGLLTARVMVNRFWYLLFGEGLARVLDDFGGQGEPPSHPELLDNLAWAFVDWDWDVKRMIKFMILSQTYRQASLQNDVLRERDPYNRLWARQSRWRLPAEMVRDNALAISGLLVDKVGGPSVKPYQPAGYYRHLNFPPREYEPDTDARQWRRGVYMHWQRQFLHPMLKAFDAPTREECTARRPRSNTPLASLTLLNDPTFVEAARVLAGRILREGGEDLGSRLDYTFQLAVSRRPDAVERDVLEELYRSNRAAFEADSEAAFGLLGIGLAPREEGWPAEELGAWTMVARAVLNLNETLTRN